MSVHGHRVHAPTDVVLVSFHFFPVYAKPHLKYWLRAQMETLTH